MPNLRRRLCPQDSRPRTRIWTPSGGFNQRRAGHVSPTAALRYQHATEDRDRVLAEALAKLAHVAQVVPIAAEAG
jgi:hypothetical protein